jgi:cytochrome c oxidase subunit 3/cytochrome o ubiquinol oxidase subunit 3
MTATTAPTTAHGDGHSHGDAPHAHGGGHYTSLGLDSRKIAIWTFIGSECMLFASLISTYLIYKGRSPEGPFPHETWTNPMTGEVFKPSVSRSPPSPFVLLSSLAAVLRSRRQNANAETTACDRILVRIVALDDVLLGIISGLQAYEFVLHSRRLRFAPTCSARASSRSPAFTGPT